MCVYTCIQSYLAQPSSAHSAPQLVVSRQRLERLNDDRRHGGGGSGGRGQKERFAVGFAPPVGGSAEEPGPALDAVFGGNDLFT